MKEQKAVTTDDKQQLDAEIQRQSTHRRYATELVAALSKFEWQKAYRLAMAIASYAEAEAKKEYEATFGDASQ